MSSLDARAVAALAARTKHEVESGASTAAQFAIGLHGEIVAAQSFGTATTAPEANCAGSNPPPGSASASPTTLRNKVRAPTPTVSDTDCE